MDPTSGPTELLEGGAVRLADRVRRGEVSAREVAEAALARIEAEDPALGAFLHVTRERALAAADEVDRKRARGEDPGPLAGVPLAIKDNMALSGEPTTCASRILEGYRPVFDATAVRRLLDAGAVPVGKTNLDEFAMGSSNENSAFHPCRNPWDRTRVPGGSSGGSAAAVAARMAPISLGSDTGGSIRLPASFCGVLGLKPTYGAVSRYGLVAFASSLDQIGPMATDAADLARVLSVLVGRDPSDAPSLEFPDPGRIERGLGDGVRGLRIGVVEEMFGAGLQPGVEAAVRASLAALEAAGAELRPVRLPHTRYGVPTYYIVASAEASSNLARYDGVRYGLRAPTTGDIHDLYRATRKAGFGSEVKRRIILGTFVLSSGYHDAWYQKAQRVRTLLRREVEAVLDEVDVLAGPTCPTPAFPIGERSEDPLAMYLTDVCTIVANLAGIPGLSIPVGFTGPGRLPVGLQVLGKAFSEPTLLRVARTLEATGAPGRERPPR